MKEKLKRMEDSLRAKLAIEHELEQIIAANNREKDRLIQAISECRNAIRLAKLQAKREAVKPTA